MPMLFELVFLVVWSYLSWSIYSNYDKLIANNIEAFPEIMKRKCQKKCVQRIIIISWVLVVLITVLAILPKKY